MGIDVENQILAQIKDSKAFALQLDESTDISKKAQLFVWFYNRRGDFQNT